MPADCFLIAGSMSLLLPRMDPDVHDRFRIAAIFRVPAIFPMIFASPASRAWKNAADSREQGENA
jgi:hypothetical protein